MGCPGKRDNHTCNAQLYRCKSCGNVGCDHGQDGKCTNQAFKTGKCLKCGKSGQKELFR